MSDIDDRNHFGSHFHPASVGALVEPSFLRGTLQDPDDWHTRSAVPAAGHGERRWRAAWMVACDCWRRIVHRR